MPKWFQTTKAKISPKKLIFIVTFSIFILHLATVTNLKPKIYDEIYYASIANSYFLGRLSFDVHPPLGKEIMATGIWLFGDNNFGWRFFPAFFHSLLIPLTYLITTKIFKNQRTGVVAALLLASETLLFTLGQFALLEIFTVFFIMLATYLLLLYLDQRKNYLLTLFAFALGAALTTKWSALGPSLALLIILTWKLKTKRWLTLASCLLIITAFYLLTFWPHFLKNENVWLWHLSTIQYHLTYPKTHSFSSPWWLWPLDFRGVLLYFQEKNSFIQGVYLIGNPVLFLLQILAVIYAFKKRLLLTLIIPLGLFAGGWLEWFPTKTGFIYNFAPALPFGLILAAVVLNQEEFRPYQKYILGISFVFWLFFLPLLVGWRVPDWFYYLHLLPSWR